MAGCFEHGYALLIGVSDNALPRLALPTVGRDVEAVRRVLVHPERCGYPPPNVRSLRGQEATRAEILAGLEWLQERIRSDGSGNATAVVYYSGHGWRDTAADPSEFFLIPYDMRDDRFRSSALRAPDFAEALDALQPRRLLVILDCCHAAGMDVKGLSAVPAGFSETAITPDLLMGEGSRSVFGSQDFGKLAAGAGRAVLSSSTGEQQSYIRRDGAMSIFTYHLIEALSGHARPLHGATEVLVSDVMGHVSRHVPRTAMDEWGARQEPVFRVRGNFAVALLLGGRGLGEGQRAPDPLTVFEEAGGSTLTMARDVITTTIGTVDRSVVIVGVGNIAVQNTTPCPEPPARDRAALQSPAEEPETEGGSPDG